MYPDRYRQGLILILLARSAIASAQVAPEEHAAHHPGQQSNTTEASKTNGPEQKAVKDSQAEQAKMQALMDKIQRTKDPAERKKLLEEHRKAMHDELRTMEQMKCHGNMADCHEKMEARMDMTAELLEQMLEHEEAER